MAALDPGKVKAEGARQCTGLLETQVGRRVERLPEQFLCLDGVILRHEARVAQGSAPHEVAAFNPASRARRALWQSWPGREILRRSTAHPIICEMPLQRSGYCPVCLRLPGWNTMKFQLDLTEG